jgi:hypothetical protein
MRIEHEEPADSGWVNDSPEQIMDYDSRSGDETSSLLIQCASILTNNIPKNGLQMTSKSWLRKSSNLWEINLLNSISI